MAPASSNSRWPRAADHERQQARPLGRVGRRLGAFESAENSRANCDRVFDVLETRRVRAPFHMAKIAVRRARRENEMIVADLAAIDHDRSPRRVDARHRSPQHADGAVVAKQSADRKRDVGG